MLDLPYHKYSLAQAKHAMARMGEVQGLVPSSDNCVPHGVPPDCRILGDCSPIPNTSAASEYVHEASRWLAGHVNWKGPAAVWADPYVQANILKAARGSDSIARRLLLRRSYVACHFNPGAAARVLTYLNAQKVLDPCAGWGDRLAASMAIRCERYVGCDPNSRLHVGYAQQIRDLNIQTQTNIMCGAFEDTPINETFDTVFTSPPYWRTEIYSNDADQSINRYTNYDEWKNRFLSVLLQKSCDCLIEGGHLALNIANVCLGGVPFFLVNDSLSFATQLPLTLVGVVRLPLMSRGSLTKHEPIMIWKKHGR